MDYDYKLRGKSDVLLTGVSVFAALSGSSTSCYLNGRYENMNQDLLSGERTIRSGSMTAISGYVTRGAAGRAILLGGGESTRTRDSTLGGLYELFGLAESVHVAVSMHGSASLTGASYNFRDQADSDEQVTGINLSA